MRLQKLLFLSWLSTTVLLVSSCAKPECLGLCNSPIELFIKGKPGAAAPEVTVTGADGNCVSDSTEANLVVCHLGFGAGNYVLEVSAPSYATRHVEILVDATKSSEPCACGYDTSSQTISLEPS